MIANRWLILAVLFLVRTGMGFQFQTVGSLSPVIVDAFAIDYATLGLLVGLYLLPGVVIALPGGMLGDRFGPRQTALFGLVLMVLGGILTGASGSLPWFIVGRLISGAGAVIMNVVVTRMVVDWFAGREIGTAMALLVASWPFGIALGLLIFAPLADALGWQSVMFVGALFCAGKFALLALFYQSPLGAPPASGVFKLDLTPREWRLVLVAGSVWGAYNVAYIVQVSFLPAVFTGQGQTLAQAASVVSLLGWALMIVVPIGGYLADRTGRPGLVMLIGLLITALGTALVSFPQFTLGAYAVMLLVAGLPAGAIMTLPAEAARAEARGSATGVYFAWSYGLMALLPSMAGYLRDITDSRAVPMLFAAAMLAMGAVGVALFRTMARPAAAPAR